MTNYSEFELLYIYRTIILRPLPTKLEHFYLFDLCRTKNVTSDLFNNYETVRRR